ncbi:MAG: hypothetical protein LBJ00_02665 [Planctomycetaceae bacterium]|nr:hypothetical protein [Planctomycetaceae bacterium]
MKRLLKGEAYRPYRLRYIVSFLFCFLRRKRKRTRQITIKTTITLTTNTIKNTGEII